MFIAMTVFGASQEMEFYQQLYNIAPAAAEKYAVFQEAQNAGLSDAMDFYAWVLERVVLEYPNVKGNQNIEAANESMKTLAKLLGEAKHLPSAGYLWRAETVFVNPIVKAEILVALGKMQAVDFLPQVIQTLKDLNEGRVSKNSQDRERIAFGAIVSLENYGDIRGYLPVYLASIGWYSDTIKRQAAASLPKISENPVEPLTELIKSPSYPYNTKYEALQTIENSSASADVKSEFAVTAYTEAWKASTVSRTQQMDLVRIRKLCISMINRYKTGNSQVYPLLERSYTEGTEEEERFGAVSALASLASEDSIRLLSAFVKDINEKLREGTLRQKDERMIRALIAALGQTGRSEVVSVLVSIQSVDWPTAVKRLAAQEIEKLQ
ncbi:MAG: HEAT repeat domain-containing protein [Treponema sp.]|nr:HEAT repeat domain-containing protein [Treponema sp.]